MLAQRLCAEGFDVVTVAEHVTVAAAWRRGGDAVGGHQGRRLVTENVKDFQPLVQLASEPAALVLFTSSRRFPGPAVIRTPCSMRYAAG